MRWARRHRPAVAAAAVLLVTATVASGLGTWLIWKEERKTAEQKRQAEENYQLARDLSVGAIDLVAANEAEYAADPAKHKARKELLVAAAKAHHKHLEHQPNDPEVRRQAARVFRYAANVHRLEREFAAAEPLYRDAVGLLEGLAKEFPEEAAYRLQLSETLRDRAKVQSTLGHLSEAVATLDRVIDLADALLATDPKDSGYRRAMAAARLNRSTARLALGDLPAARTDAAAAAAEFKALAQDPEAPHPYDELLRGAALNALAIVEREAGRPEKAGPLHVEAIGLLMPLAEKGRAGLNRGDALDARSALILEQCRTIKGNPKVRTRVENNLGAVADQWERLAASNPRVPQYREASGVAYYERGVLRAEDGRADEARADLTKARDIQEAAVRQCPDVPGLSADLGRTYAGLGGLARAGGDPAAAGDWLAKAVRALRSAAERAPDDVRIRRDLAALEADAAR
jgi:tetratricopeptide (TPR) repeat protein